MPNVISNPSANVNGVPMPKTSLSLNKSTEKESPPALLVAIVVLPAGAVLNPLLSIVTDVVPAKVIGSPINTEGIIGIEGLFRSKSSSTREFLLMEPSSTATGISSPEFHVPPTES